MDYANNFVANRVPETVTVTITDTSVRDFTVDDNDPEGRRRRSDLVFDDHPR